MKKTLTINGKRYTISTRSYDDNLDIRGPRINRAISGVSIDSPDLRERVIAAIEIQKVCDIRSQTYIASALANTRDKKE